MKPQNSCRMRSITLPAEAIGALAKRRKPIRKLRLAALALRYSPDADSRIAELRALEHNRNLTDYLMSEVLAQTPLPSQTSC